jgi:hypothetical protein
MVTFTEEQERQRRQRIKHGVLSNTGDRFFIPSRDGASVIIQSTGYPIEHRECGHYWITTSKLKQITCPGCGSTINRKKSLTLFRGEM